MDVVCLRPLAAYIILLSATSFVGFVHIQFQLQQLLPGYQPRNSNTMSDSDSDKSNDKAGHNENMSDFTE